MTVNHVVALCGIDLIPSTVWLYHMFLCSFRDVTEIPGNDHPELDIQFVASLAPDWVRGQCCINCKPE